MKKKCIIFITLVFVFTAFIAFGQNNDTEDTGNAEPSAWYNKSVALVVSVGEYENGRSKLSESNENVTRLTGALKAHGFEVITLSDAQATGSNILRQIETNIPAKVDVNERFVFYFSGCGKTRIDKGSGKRTGYLIPAAGGKPGLSDDWAGYIPMDALRAKIIDKLPGRHVLMVFDFRSSDPDMVKSGGTTESVNYWLGQPAINVLIAQDAGQSTPAGTFADEFTRAIDGSADGVGGQRDGYVTFIELAAHLKAQIPSGAPGFSLSFGWWDGTSQMLFRHANTVEPSDAPPEPAALADSADSPEKSKHYPSVRSILSSLGRKRREKEASESKDQVRLEEIRKKYTDLQQLRENLSISKVKKYKEYKLFLVEYPDDNPYYEQVTQWVEESCDPDCMDMIRRAWLAVPTTKNACEEHKDYDYFPKGGMQAFACHLLSFAPYKVLSELSGMDVFLKGPHTNEKLNFSSKNSFGYYNPEFVKWMVDNAVPAAKDAAFRKATQWIYDKYVAELAEIFYLTYQKILKEPECFERQKKEFQILLDTDSLQWAYYTKYFFFMNDKFCENPDGGFSFFYKNGFDKGVNGAVVATSFMFWVRRSIDGTMDEFYRGLVKLRETYKKS